MVNSLRYFLVALCFVPLFFIRFQHTASPFFAELLDVGHIGVFFVVGWFALPMLAGGLLRKILVLITIVFLASIIIESLQEFVGRAFQWIDIARNYMGLGLSIALRTYFTTKGVRSKVTAVLGFVLLSVITLFECQTFLKLAAGKIYFQVKAPILADFKYQFEVESWKTKFARLELTDTGLLVQTEVERSFSSVFFRDFPSDWREFQKLHIDIENLQSQPLILNLKITDLEHEIGLHHYDERYNGVLNLSPGNNSFIIDLSAVKQAPKNRPVNMAEIKRIELFLNDLRGDVKFRIKTLYLSETP